MKTFASRALAVVALYAMVASCALSADAAIYVVG